MDKIYEYEDKVQEVKFLLSALKIENAFLNIDQIVNKKLLNYQHTFMDKLRRNKVIQTIRCTEELIEKCSDIYENIKCNKIRSVFQQILHYSEKNDKNRKTSDGFNVQNKMKSFSVINQQDWKEKFTIQQLQSQCQYYRLKIEEVQNCFTEFFQVIKRE